MNDLPTSWATVRIGDVANVVRGVTFPADSKESSKSSTNVCCLRTSHVQSTLRWDDAYYVPLKYVKRVDQFVQVGDILMSMANSYELVGKVAMATSVPEATAFGAFLSAVRPTALTNAPYLFHLLRSQAVQAALRGGSSQTTNIANISVARLSEIDVPLAPLGEQQRIADKLDTVLTRVDACRGRLARVAPLLERFRQSVLAAATSGRLTEDIEPRFDSQAKTLASLGVVSGGLTKNAKRDELPMRRPYLRVANVHANELRLGDVTDIGLTEAEFTKTRLVEGDLLIVEGNGSIEQIGRVAMWSGEIADCCHQNHLIRWRAGACVLPKFVLFFLLSPEGRRQIEAVASSTTGLHTLSVSKISELQLPVPSLELQVEIVRRVESLFAYADRLETRLAQAQTAVDRLTPSLLSKAFRGELVPQDPDDEPAAELLKRLAAQHAAASPKLRKTRRSQPA